MDDSRNNNINISGPVENSTISLHQNQDGNQSIKTKNIEYEIVDGTCRVINYASLDKANNFFTITVLTSGLAVIADIAGLLSYIGVEKGLGIVVLVPIVAFVAMLTTHKRWMFNLPANDSSHFKDGEWYQKLPDGNVAVYLKKAKCIYPKCSGVINIVPAPERERPNHSLVGKCSLGGVQHTYTVDYSNIGYPRQFDWRPVPKHESGDA